MHFYFKVFQAVFVLIQGGCLTPKWGGLWVESDREMEEVKLTW